MRKLILLIIVAVMMSPVIVFAQVATSESISNAGAVAISAPNINNTPIAISAPTASGNTSVGNSNDVGAIAVIQSAPNFLQPQPIYPYLLQMIPGVIADVTKEMPLYANIRPLTTEQIVRVITFNGNIFDRIRMEDVEQEVIDHLSKVMGKFGVKTTDDIRFKVRFKMSSRTIGSGGGGGGSTAGFGGGSNPMAYGTNASIMPGIAVNTADPQFVISYYLIKTATKAIPKIKTLYERIEPKNEPMPTGTKIGD